ncbi:MAG: hypothetical protein NC395_07390 [Prevotella sp.]|nr:hypothetical protein [Prevotella sp.]
MEMPNIEEIFLQMGLEKFSSYMLDDEEKTLRGYIETLVKEKKLDNSVAERVLDTEKDICLYSKCAGFEQGFRFAVRLLLS